MLYNTRTPGTLPNYRIPRGLNVECQMLKREANSLNTRRNGVSFKAHDEIAKSEGLNGLRSHRFG
jgi:hypothetical protein